MIGWLQGQLNHPWQQDKRYGLLLVCQGVGYEVQVSQRQWQLLPLEPLSGWRSRPGQKIGSESACAGYPAKWIETEYQCPLEGMVGPCTVGPQTGPSLRFIPQPMPLTTTKQQELINGHQTHGTDTGSVEVQVAMLSERVSQLTGHLQKNKHDFSSRQGLLKMIGRRKRLLGYLNGISKERYSALIAKLGIRG